MNRFETIKELREKLNQLLAESPHLRKMQEEIDLKLRQAGSQENRLVLVNEMMMDKFQELNQKLQDFNISKSFENMLSMLGPYKSAARITEKIIFGYFFS